MTQATILDKIVMQKKADLEIRQAEFPLAKLVAELEKEASRAPSFYDALSKTPETAIIAEIKRVSPSKGPLRPDLNPLELAIEYQEAGAKAISVLTEEKFFGGSDDDLKAVRQKAQVPILRKDFTICEYQIWEAKLLGASAILLIAAILSEAELKSFSQLASQLKLDVLLEVHDRAELEKALKAQPNIIGVNNRNLHNFSVDLKTSFDLIREFQTAGPELWVSESGIYTKEQIKQLEEAGYKAFLIGESLLKAQSPARKLQELI